MQGLDFHGMSKLEDQLEVEGEAFEKLMDQSSLSHKQKGQINQFVSTIERSRKSIMQVMKSEVVLKQQYQEQNIQLKLKNNDLENEVKNFSEEVSKQQEELNELQVENETLKELLEQYESSKQKLEGKLEQARTRDKELVEEIEKIIEQMKTMQTQIIESKQNQLSQSQIKEIVAITNNSDQLILGPDEGTQPGSARHRNQLTVGAAAAKRRYRPSIDQQDGLQQAEDEAQGQLPKSKKSLPPPNASSKDLDAENEEGKGAQLQPEAASKFHELSGFKKLKKVVKNFQKILSQGEESDSDEAKNKSLNFSQVVNQAVKRVTKGQMPSKPSRLLALSHSRQS